MKERLLISRKWFVFLIVAWITLGTGMVIYVAHRGRIELNRHRQPISGPFDGKEIGQILNRFGKIDGGTLYLAFDPIGDLWICFSSDWLPEGCEF